MNNKRLGILGTGSYVPDKVLNNFDLMKMVDTSDEWIIKRTGISERRILEEGEPYHKMGVAASERALKDAGIEASQIDLIITTTNTPDYLVPSAASMIQNDLKAVNAATFDLNAACSGFIYGLTTAAQFIKTGYYRHILVVSCEALSRMTDWEDRNSCILFGDGAGAVITGPVEDGSGLIDSFIGTDGSLGHYITAPCGLIREEDIEKRLHANKRVLWMDGSEVFKFAVRIMESATREILARTALTIDDIKLIIPHQANIRILEGAAKRLDISMDKIYTNLHKYGNISSASIPVAIDEAFREGRIKEGDYILLVGFGGGLTWGSAVIKWGRASIS